MRLIVVVEPEPQSVEVNISIRELMSELESMNDPQTKCQLTALLNACITAIDSIPIDLIKELSDVQRATVVGAMINQIDRYS